MYRNKRDIDKHVENLKSKLSIKEFNTRAYSIARLYFDVGDYNNCQKYVEQFISQKDNNAAAYKLLGQALQKLGQKEKAFDHYRTSFNFNPTQTDLLLDICELLAEDQFVIDPGTAKYWCEKAEATFPRNPVIFRLREKLLAKDDPNPEALENLLKSELFSRPRDASLHSRLLRHYLSINKIKEAFGHSFNIEFSSNNFPYTFAWYENLSEILKNNSLNPKEWQYQLLLLTVRERLCLLSLSEVPSGNAKSLLEISDLLHQYDQAIHNVYKTGAPSGCVEFHSSLIQHHRGQFSLHAATYLLKKAKKDQINWKEATKYASPFLLIAWHSVILDSKVNWLNHAPEVQQTAVKRWYLEGSYRCSQTGHYLLTNIQEKEKSFLDAVSQLCLGKDWQEKFYDKLYTTKDQKMKKLTSYLMSESMTGPSLRLPKKLEVEAYDSEAQRYYANSLHHFVWMLLNYKNLENFKLSIFEMLPSKTSSYQICGPESLNKLDVLSYLYFATLSTQQDVAQHHSSNGQPTLLPANITDLLCSSVQMKWWDCALKFSQNMLGTELTDIRLTLARGIEVVRCVDNHGLDPEMLCKVGRIFTKLAKSATSYEDVKSFESRANLYYTSALSLLEKLRNKFNLHVPEKRVFNYTHKEMSSKEFKKLIEECQIEIAIKHMNESEFEEAVELLVKLKSPKAYFHLSKCYMKMAQDEMNSSKDFSKSESKSKCSTLLAKAKNYAYKTLETVHELRNDRDDPLYAQTQNLIEEIEAVINRQDINLSETCVQDTETHYLSDENGSIHGIDNSVRDRNSHFRNVSSTPKQNSNQNLTNYRTAVDSQFFETTRYDSRSLDRIESQFKNLQRRDATVNHFIEKTQSWFEDNRDLGKLIGTINANVQNTTDQFKLLKISVDQVKDQVDECRKECKDVGELKKQIAELKKEVQKLKKVSSEQAVNESDAYSIEDEYRGNDNTSAFSPQIGFNPAHLMPPLNQRLISPFPVPTNPYQLYGQNMYHLYNQYSQFAQTPTGVPPGPPLFDPSRPPVNYSQMFSPEQMYQDMSHFLPSSTAQVAPLTSLPSMPPVPTIQPLASKAPAAKPTLAPPISTLNIPKPTATVLPKDTSKALPVNVVITSSDPLPTLTSVPQPVLSVTIPPKHIKNSPHNYQIAMPTTNDSAVPPTIFRATVPNEANAKPFAAWNQNISFKASEVSSPKVNSSLTQSPFTPNDPNKSLQFDNSATVVDGNISHLVTPNASMNKSRTLSEKSNASVEYDPCPDFKPIIPLPDEVKVTTGEEDETPVFSSRAKLFRYSDKQWKERGLGEMKLLKHNVSGKVRVLMRREQIHKICANHIITADMEINPMKNETRAYVWAANDFADEEVVLEKFCVKFKTAEIAQQFYEAFEKARKEAVSTPETTPKSNEKATSKTFGVSTENTPKDEKNAGKAEANEKKKDVELATPKDNKKVIGGFTFTSTPTFKPTEKPIVKSPTSDSNKVNPFSSFSFKPNANNSFSNLINLTNTPNVTQSTPQQNEENSNLNNSDTVEEFEPNIDFKPVVPLPALVEFKTGEEDEVVLFEHRAKLLRFVTTKDSKEWKERGLGVIKLLMHKDNNQKVRLLMRREQVMKVCCNHALTKEMVFEKMPNMETAVTWCAKDFSEGELTPETFCLRFKTVQICDDFVKAIKHAQSKMSEGTKADKEEQNAAKQTNQTGFGDKFKPKPGSWHCNDCYTNNLENFTKCACCEKPKPGTAAPQKTSTTGTGWGDTFKPKPGSWECKQCLVRNDETKHICSACNSSKDASGVVQSGNKPSEAKVKFSFGIPGQTANQISPEKPVTTTPTSGWGDKFKPKTGSWECKQCFVRNDEGKDICCACNSPKDTNAAKKESKSVFETAPGTPKFSFGIPPATTNDTKQQQNSNENSIFDGTGQHKFTFGLPSSTTISFGSQNSPLFGASKKADAPSPLNFSLKKSDDITIKPALLETPQNDSTSKEMTKGSSFDFQFKPKTPQKGKSPMTSPKSEKGEDSDNEYASEDEGHHIHFNPIIPLPDKVEVVTGEEREEELYAHRAKLYRFVTGDNQSEWKERGLGVVKILKHKETGKIRVVMRREQVLKICLNHALTKDIIYTPKEDKAWIFAANDFSDGELKLEKFCIRFKNKDIAQEFKNAIENARGEVIVAATENDTTSDVVFVCEIQASDEDKKRAKELMLPENFFTYKDKESCQGCRGCTEDDDSEKVAITPAKGKSPLFQTPHRSFYSTPTSIDKTENTSIFRTPLDSINSNSGKFSSASNSSFISSIDKENKADPKPNIFGGLSGNANFGFSQKNIVFGGSSETPPSTKSGGILAPPKLSTSNCSDSFEPKSIFGSAQNQFKFGDPAAAKSTAIIFGDPPATSAGENKAWFGSSSTTAEIKGPTSIFGGANVAATNESKSLFGLASSAGDKSQSEAKSIFGGDGQYRTDIFTGGPGSLFGPSSTNKTGGLFGHPTFDNDSTGFGAGKSIFGAPANQPPKDLSKVQENPKTNNVAANIFAQAVELYKTPTNDSVDKSAGDAKEPSPFKIDNTLSFAALSGKESAFNVKKEEDFKWEGAGTQLFGVDKSKGKEKSHNEGDQDESVDTAAGGDEEYDPHYEPIVPLPDKIEVTTGEEDEEKLFGERSKLYRFEDSTKEWKERGVGELKILYHPEKKTYRLLLRREQVHKVVLNMLLHMDFELLPMNKSTSAWTWAAHNFVDGESAQETLAAKFKNAALANQFKDKVIECVRKLQAADAQAIREKEAAEKFQVETIAPLRIPKHLAETGRADAAIAIAANQLARPSAEVNEPRSSGTRTNGDADARAVLFQEQEHHADDEDEDDDDAHYEHDDYYEPGYDEDVEVTYESEGLVLVQSGAEQRACDAAYVQVLYDQEYDAPKILVSDSTTGEDLVNMLIHTDTDFKLSGTACLWSGTDYSGHDPEERAVTFTFPDADSALRFYDSCESSKATCASRDPDEC